MRAFWLSIVRVPSADATEARALELGGAVEAKMDLIDGGHFAFVTDPAGAQFGIWEPPDWIGAEPVNEPGCLAWHELTTRDSEAAFEFYSAVFGWRFEPIETSDLGYWSVAPEGTAEGRHARMRERTELEEEHEMPAHWMPYFAVGSADAVVERVESSGGIAMPVLELSTGERISILFDRQRAQFGVLEGEWTTNRPVPTHEERDRFACELANLRR